MAEADMEILLPEKRRDFGQLQEQTAARFLAAAGLELLMQNFSCRAGEIDLIMREERTLVFVEVRFRRSSRYGTATETVDRRKQRKLVKAASYFLSSRRINSAACRFDIVGLTPAQRGDTGYDPVSGLRIDWLRNAFGC